jgi:Uma2 family endonuclease
MHLDTSKLPQRKFTPTEFDAMCEAGILGEDERIELIEGVLVPMVPPGPVHINLVDRLTQALVKAAPDNLLVSVQNPLACGQSRPQPDLSVRPASPTLETLPSQALLVVEVAHSTLSYDREKLAVYAAAGVPEVWLVNVPEQVVEVYTEPDAEVGRYRVMRVMGERETLTTQALPALRLPVAVLFAQRH